MWWRIRNAARSVIEEAGFGRFFTHGLGHGLGLDIHENPFFRRENPALLKAGMVVTIEPGIYLPDWGGIRIEDDVLVTPDGPEGGEVPREGGHQDADRRHNSSPGWRGRKESASTARSSSRSRPGDRPLGRRPGVKGGAQLPPMIKDGRQQGLVLRGEIVEERAGGDVARGGDGLGRQVLVALLAGQPQGSALQGPA